MTDRPALAQRIVDALRDEDRLFAPASGSLPIVARVLAEHETYWTQDELDAAKWRAHERAAGFDVPCARAEAAEARCAQLEEERNELRKSRLRILLDEARRRLAEYEAEHERLRADLAALIRRLDDSYSDVQTVGQCADLIEAALVPSQESVK